ncbi:VTT domain-containing protein [soil metagenome]
MPDETLPNTTLSDAVPAVDGTQPSLLAPGRNCWRVEHADRTAFLVDGCEYYPAVRAAMRAARRSIFILGWDIDSRMRLVPEGANDGYPEPLAEFLDALAHEHQDLHIHVLSWDYAMLFALEREWLSPVKLGWTTHGRLRFHMDGCHPVGASHHQKIVVVDDAIAFTGGFDITRCRWDSHDHAETDPRRIDPDGKPYAPFHDIQMAVDGAAAAAMGELARTRWLRATGKAAPAVQPRDAGDGQIDPWPHGLTVDLADVDVGIARTEPGFEDFESVSEVRDLYVDLIGAARESIYIENQYFSSTLIAQTLARRLGEADAPDIVMVLPQKQSGTLEENTMGVLRARLHATIVAADTQQRYRLYCPQLPGPTHCEPEGADPQQCLNVHSKIAIIDDELLTIGSANLSNRSMGFDTECNFVIEARGDARIAAAIAAFRHRLLAEHLDRSADEVAEQCGSGLRLGAAVDALTVAAGRTLLRLDPKVAPEIDRLVPDASMIIDPAQTAETELLIAEMVPRDDARPTGHRMLGIVVAIVVLAVLAMMWRFTPLREWLDLDRLIAAGEQLKQLPFTPLVVMLAYVVAGLLVIPVTLMVAVTGIVFGPLLGIPYALAGACLSASVLYGIGNRLGGRKLRRIGGSRIQRLANRIAKRGLIAMIVLRLLPVAPFSLVNVVAGAARLQFRDFILGTLIGMLPGVLVTTVFIDRIVAVVRRPGFDTFGVLIVAVAAFAIAALWFRARLARRRDRAAAVAVATASASLKRVNVADPAGAAAPSRAQS